MSFGGTDLQDLALEKEPSNNLHGVSTPQPEPQHISPTFKD